MLMLTFKEVADIHNAMNYGSNPKVQEAFNRLCNEVQGAAYANVYNAPSYGDYTDAIEEMDDA